MKEYVVLRMYKSTKKMSFFWVDFLFYSIWGQIKLFEKIFYEIFEILRKTKKLFFWYFLYDSKIVFCAEFKNNIENFM